MMIVGRMKVNWDGFLSERVGEDSYWWMCGDECMGCVCDEVVVF